MSTNTPHQQVDQNKLLSQKLRSEHLESLSTFLNASNKNDNKNTNKNSQNSPTKNKNSSKNLPNFAELLPTPQWLTPQAIVSWLLIKGNQQEQKEYMQFINNVNSSTIRYNALQRMFFHSCQLSAANPFTHFPTFSPARPCVEKDDRGIYCPSAMNIVRRAKEINIIFSAVKTFIHGYDISLPNTVYTGKDFNTILSNDYIENSENVQSLGSKLFFGLLSDAIPLTPPNLFGSESHDSSLSPVQIALRVARNIQSLLKHCNFDYNLATKMANSLKLQSKKVNVLLQQQEQFSPRSGPIINVIGDDSDRVENKKCEINLHIVPNVSNESEDGLSTDVIIPTGTTTTTTTTTMVEKIDTKITQPLPLSIPLGTRITAIDYLLKTNQFLMTAESTSLDSECVHEQEVEIQQQQQVQVEQNKFNNFINDRDAFPFTFAPNTAPFFQPNIPTQLQQRPGAKNVNMDSICEQIKQKQVEQFLTNSSSIVVVQSDSTSKAPKSSTGTDSTVVDPKSPKNAIAVKEEVVVQPAKLQKSGVGNVSFTLLLLLDSFAVRSRPTIGFVNWKNPPTLSAPAAHLTHPLYLLKPYNQFETKLLAFIYTFGTNNSASRREIFDQKFVDDYTKKKEEEYALLALKLEQDGLGPQQELNVDGLDGADSNNDNNNNDNNNNDNNNGKINVENVENVEKIKNNENQQSISSNLPTQIEQNLSSLLPKPLYHNAILNSNSANIYPFSVATELHCPTSLLTTRAFTPTLLNTFKQGGGNNKNNNIDEELQEQYQGLRMRNIHLVAEITHHTINNNNNNNSYSINNNIVINEQCLELLPIYMRLQLSQLFSLLSTISNHYYSTNDNTQNNNNNNVTVVKLEIITTLFKQAGLRHLLPYITPILTHQRTKSTTETNSIHNHDGFMTQVQFELLFAQALADSQQFYNKTAQKTRPNVNKNNNLRQDDNKMLLLTMYESASLRRVLAVNGHDHIYHNANNGNNTKTSIYSTITLRDKDFSTFSTSDNTGCVHNWSNLPKQYQQKQIESRETENVNWSKFAMKELIRLIDGDTFFSHDGINAILAATTPVDSYVSILTQDDLKSFNFIQRLSAIRHFNDAHNRKNNDTPIINKSSSNNNNNNNNLGKGNKTVQPINAPKTDKNDKNAQNNVTIHSSNAGIDLSRYTSCIQELLSLTTHIELLLSLVIQYSFFHELFLKFIQNNNEKLSIKKFSQFITNNVIENAFESLLSLSSTINSNNNTDNNNNSNDNDNTQLTQSITQKQTTLPRELLFKLITSITNTPTIDNNTFSHLYKQFVTFSSNSPNTNNSTPLNVDNNDGNNSSTIDPTSGSGNENSVNFIDFTHWVHKIATTFDNQ
jgi:hypothetical protein